MRRFFRRIRAGLPNLAIGLSHTLFGIMLGSGGELVFPGQGPLTTFAFLMSGVFCAVSGIIICARGNDEVH